MPDDARPGWTVHLLHGALDAIGDVYADCGSRGLAPDLPLLKEARDRLTSLINLIQTGGEISNAA
jgi:hypothetical protein